MIDWSAVPIEQALPGITRQTLHGERSIVIRYVYAAGSVFPTHGHPEEQTTVVLTGCIAFVADGREVTLGPGESLLVPPDVPHSARVIGDEAVETINVLAPRRSASPRVG